METFEVECVDRHDAKPYTVKVSADSPEQAAERAANVHVVAGVRGHSRMSADLQRDSAESDTRESLRRLAESSERQAAALAAVLKELEHIRASSAMIGSRVRARALAPAIVLGLVIAVPVLFVLYSLVIRAISQG